MQGKERIVNIVQKLVVFKNTDTGEKAQFLLTLLPCYGYVNAHKGEDIAGLFMQGGTKSGFSGLALYISPESGIVYGVSSFVNGHRTGTATCSSDKATVRAFASFLPHVRVWKISAGITTWVSKWRMAICCPK